MFMKGIKVSSMAMVAESDCSKVVTLGKLLLFTLLSLLLLGVLYNFTLNQ